MKKWFLLVMVFFSLSIFAASLNLSSPELANLNRERQANGFAAIQAKDLSDDLIQNDLDKRLDDNLTLIRAKKSPLQAMPLMEKLGRQNADREEKRQNAYRNALDALK